MPQYAHIHVVHALSHPSHRSRIDASSSILSHVFFCTFHLVLDRDTSGLRRMETWQANPTTIRPIWRKSHRCRARWWARSPTGGHRRTRTKEITVDENLLIAPPSAPPGPYPAEPLGEISVKKIKQSRCDADTTVVHLQAKGSLRLVHRLQAA